MACEGGVACEGGGCGMLGREVWHMREGGVACEGGGCGMLGREVWHVGLFGGVLLSPEPIKLLQLWPL